MISFHVLILTRIVRFPKGQAHEYQIFLILSMLGEFSTLHLQS